MTEIRRRFTGAYTLQVESRADLHKGWNPVSHLVALGYEAPFAPGWELRHAISYGGRPGTPVLPFQPLSVRHLYGSERAILQVAYGNFKRLPPPAPAAWESVLGAARGRLATMAQAGNGEVRVAYRLKDPLSVVPSTSPLSLPAGATALNYEPRLGFVIAEDLADATPEQARAAISAFVLVCEFDGSDLEPGVVRAQTTEPISIAEIAVPAADLLDSWPQLTGTVSINGEVEAELSVARSRPDLGVLLAAASAGQQLRAGELFSVGALAAAGAESLDPGDHLVLDVPRLGRIAHMIG